MAVPPRARFNSGAFAAKVSIRTRRWRAESPNLTGIGVRQIDADAQATASTIRIARRI
jgi:hypothetical protein